jgi:hypothetical protein
MRPMYTLSVDEEFTEDGLPVGTIEIANTTSPAIKTIGFAFSSNQSLYFKDELKYRIAAPVLMPSIIFRKDPETGEEYDIKVTEDAVEKMFFRFMRDRIGGDIFNEEHDESKRVPSFILETWLVEHPETDKAMTSYGIECKPKTWFAVQQFTDVDAYNEAVEKGQLGFSIHGNGVLKLSEQLKKANKMKKRKFIAHFADTETTDGGEIIVTTEELKEGAEVVVIGEDFTPQEGFSGEVFIEDTPVTIENDVITAIGTAEEVAAEEPVEMAAEEVVEEEVEMMETVEPEEVIEAAEEGSAPMEAYSKEEVDAKFNELMDVVAELKASMKPAEEVEASVQMSEHKTKGQLMMEKLDRLKAFKNK